MEHVAAMVVYGKQPVKEALLSEHPVNRLILAGELPQGEQTFFRRLADRREIPVEISTKGHLQRYCGAVLHQGIALLMAPYRYIDEDRLWELVGRDENPLLLILDQIQDPHNLGAILRSAEVAGVTAVVLPDKGSAGINPTVAKTSAGAVFHLPVHRTAGLAPLFEKIRRTGIYLVALSPGRPDKLHHADLTRPVAVIIGSEGKGVRKNLQQLADLTLSIPQKGKMGSLNASTSAAIVLFEIFRQREVAAGNI